MICHAFAQAYFGHVSTTMAPWGELDTFCDNYLASSGADSVLLQNNLLNIMKNHELNAYPVSDKLKATVLDWLKRVLDRNDIEMAPEMLSFKKAYENNINDDEPEYIFKTFGRAGPLYVTLLEENRDIIGHGTTGLTSWQGAMFLADWTDSFGYLLKVRAERH